MTVLAEGGEEERQHELLQSAGCDRYQGYLFARPLDLTSLIGFIRQQD